MDFIIKFLIKKCTNVTIRLLYKLLFKILSFFIYRLFWLQSVAVWQEQSAGWMVGTSATGSKWRLQLILWSWASVACDPCTRKRNVRIEYPIFCPNSVWTTLSLLLSTHNSLLWNECIAYISSSPWEISHDSILKLYWNRLTLLKFSNFWNFLPGSKLIKSVIGRDSNFSISTKFPDSNRHSISQVTRTNNCVRCFLNSDSMVNRYTSRIFALKKNWILSETYWGRIINLKSCWRCCQWVAQNNFWNKFLQS